MAASNQHPIVAGPSKWDLSVALFDRKSVNGRKVTFDVNCPTITTFEVSVTSVQAEDGSGESWNIEGMATKHANGITLRDNPPPPPQRIFIYFRTDQRRGFIRFLD